MRLASTVALFLVGLFAISPWSGPLIGAEKGAVGKAARPGLAEYRVSDADEVLDDLRDAFKPGPDLRFWATSQTSVSVWATSDDQARIAKRIEALEPKNEFDRDERNEADRDDKEDADDPDGALPPVTVTAFGNRLIVTSDDPEALALISELARLLTRTEPGEADFEVITLRNASAVEIARIIDEAFNTKPPPSSGRGRQRGGAGLPGLLLGAIGIGGVVDPSGGVERVRVVADPSVNTLIVKASALDMLTVHGLVQRLDRGPDDDVNAVIRTRVIGPLESAHAVEVAAVLRDVYKEALNGTPATGNNNVGVPSFLQRLRGGRSSRNRGMPQQNAANKPTLSIGVDEKTNSLIVAAPRSLYEDIEQLVGQMEDTAADMPSAVSVVPIEGVDASLLQQALQALQGNNVSGATSGRGRPGGATSGRTRGGSSRGRR